MERIVIAFHEAGHAAVNFHFEHAVEVVTIAQTGLAAGSVQVDRSGHDALRYEDALQNQVIFERAIMAAMAGEIAQRKHAPDSVDWDSCRGDRIMIADYMDLLDAPTQEIHDAYLRLLQLRTEALVDRLWPRIQRLAAVLMTRPTLTGKQARKALADPKL